MQLLSNVTKMCWNTTDMENGTNLNCSNHGLYITTGITAATSFTKDDLAIAEMVINLRYYIEGVILTPVATIGLFGRNK